MYRVIIAGSEIVSPREQGSTILYVKYEPANQAGSGFLEEKTFKGPTLLYALIKLCDNMVVGIDSEFINDHNYDENKIIEHLENNDSGDFIVLLKNKTTGEVYIESEEDSAVYSEE